METVRYIGWVRPRPINVTLLPILQASVDGHQLPAPVQMTLNIEGSRIQVECKMENYKAIGYENLTETVVDFAKTAISLISFATGITLVADIEMIIEPDAFPTYIVMGSTILSEYCKSYDIDEQTDESRKTFRDVLGIVLSDYALSSNMRDLASMMNMPSQAPIVCGRVLEGVRKMINPTENRAVGWTDFQTALNCSPAYATYLSDKSKKPRHGDRTYVTNDEIGDVTEKIWTIMNRFLEYRKRGNQALPLTDFPLLELTDEESSKA